jgi:hypothetical protein
MRIKTYRNGHVSMEKMFPSGMYLVQCYEGTELYDKFRCDNYMIALACFRGFCTFLKQRKG